MCRICGWDLRAGWRCSSFVPTEPDAAQEAAMQELIDLRQEMEAEARCVDCGHTDGEGCGCPPPEPATPRRPPYAVAYALADGEQYEVALPGDATVCAVDGALVITHASAVQALIQTRPMEA